MWSKLGGVVALACVPFVVLACSVNTSDGGYYSGSGGSAGSSSGGSGAAVGDGAPSEYPMTALLDTDQTMKVSPGQGVGVFVEYDTGGNWNVWWTCDSAVDSSNPACAFDVKITAQSGAITNLASTGFASGDNLSSASASLEATTTTSTGSDGVTFTTAPGARILLDAAIGGQHDGQFVFFVQGGQVNDGYNGAVTDPIYMQGSEP